MDHSLGTVSDFHHRNQHALYKTFHIQFDSTDGISTLFSFTWLAGEADESTETARHEEFEATMLQPQIKILTNHGS